LVDVLATGAEYNLYINAQNSAERLLLFEFLDSGEGQTADCRPLRAQLFPLPIREHEGDGP
jgi:hypothetical protein